MGLPRCGCPVAGVALTLAVMLAMGVMDAPSAQALTFKGLYKFSGSPDGNYPAAGLVAFGEQFYGTTGDGGAFNGGTVFELDKSGTETVLLSFRPQGQEGAYPSSGLLADSVGNFYGSTDDGRAHGYGTVFAVNTAGAETVL
jgi:uncharacterized repeat protein (TIGR03803 family)